MRVHLVTIFPEFFAGPLNCGVLRIAQEKAILQVETVALRDFADDAYRTVDDYPFGGGPGMIMKPEPVFRAVRRVKTPESWVVLLSPQGRLFAENVALELSRHAHLIFVCGHYKGVDERVHEHLVHDAISIGDYVLSGGEAAALVLLEATTRLLPGVVGDEESVSSDSFMNGLLDAPYYTRPREFDGLGVPEVLVSGDHEKVRSWRRRRALELTRDRRPDLFARYVLSEEDKQLLLEE
jgi:tRNA (guanine37-N1)-methyltransferase